MLTTDQLQRLIDSKGTAVGAAGEKLGSVGQVYLDDATGTPQWITVNTGLFGTSHSFVPLEQAVVEGDTIRVPYDKDTVKGAPRLENDGHLEPSEEEDLYRYYGLTGMTGAPHGQMSQTAEAPQDLSDRTTGHDTSGPTTDTAMTRSEEELSVGTASRERGRARLRKYVVTEQQTVNVPVSREEVRLEREPITEANVDAATSGPAISEEEHEVTLHEEVPVVSKEARPVERVRLGTETVTGEEQVTKDVRKEQIELEGEEGTGRLP
jgi:uncharacterized protein (TIGR02271 family)